MDHKVQHPRLKNPVSVIIVDDDLLVRTTATRLLEEHADVRVLGAYSNGQDALDAASAEPPSVMVVDISMPGMNGVTLTECVRARFPNTEVLAYTSLADQQTISAMLRAGASGVVYKEASVEDLAHAIVATRSGFAVLSPRFHRSLPLQASPAKLSASEKEILRLLSQGLTNEEIAPLMHVSASTVKYHLSKLSEKLDARNRVALAVAAVHLGLAE